MDEESIRGMVIPSEITGSGTKNLPEERDPPEITGSLARNPLEKKDSPRNYLLIR
jgi:hypothetical protein